MARCLILVMDGFPEEEVLGLREALRSEGHEVVLVGPERGKVVVGAQGSEVVADRDVLQLDLGQAHVVIVPGGDAAEKIAATPKMVNLVYSVLHKGRLAATIGAGAQLLVLAAAQKSPNRIATGNVLLPEDFLKGRRVASDPATREAMEKAGARPTPGAVVTDHPIITARDLKGPALDRFLGALLPLLAHAEQPVVARIL